MIFNPHKIANDLKAKLDNWVNSYDNTITLRQYMTEVYESILPFIAQGKKEEPGVQALKIVRDALMHSPHFGNRTDVACLRDIMLRLGEKSIQTQEDVFWVGRQISLAGLRIVDLIQMAVPDDTIEIYQSGADEGAGSMAGFDGYNRPDE